MEAKPQHCYCQGCICLFGMKGASVGGSERERERMALCAFSAPLLAPVQHGENGKCVNYARRAVKRVNRNMMIPCHSPSWGINEWINVIFCNPSIISSFQDLFCIVTFEISSKSRPRAQIAAFVLFAKRFRIFQIIDILYSQQLQVTFP